MKSSRSSNSSCLYYFSLTFCLNTTHNSMEFIFSGLVNIKKNVTKHGFYLLQKPRFQFFIYNSRKNKPKNLLPSQNKQDKCCLFSKVAMGTYMLQTHSGAVSKNILKMKN